MERDLLIRYLLPPCCQTAQVDCFRKSSVWLRVTYPSQSAGWPQVTCCHSGTVQTAPMRPFKNRLVSRPSRQREKTSESLPQSGNHDMRSPFPRSITNTCPPDPVIGVVKLPIGFEMGLPLHLKSASRQKSRVFTKVHATLDRVNSRKPGSACRKSKKMHKYINLNSRKSIT